MTRFRASAFLLLAAACGDNWSASGASTGGPDAAAAEVDAAADAAGEDVAATTVVVFDNADGTFAWDPYWYYDQHDYGVGTPLDLTVDPMSQTGEGSSSSLIFFKRYPEVLSNWGGFFVMGWSSGDAEEEVPHLAGDDDLFLDGPEWDITVVPPVSMSPGDAVGPDERWIDDPPFGEWSALQTVHLQDDVDQTAPSQILFPAGIIGVRFELDDGLHYAFVELAWVPDDDLRFALHIPVRWGYNPVPDQPLVIPP